VKKSIIISAALLCIIAVVSCHKTQPDYRQRLIDELGWRIEMLKANESLSKEQIHSLSKHQELLALITETQQIDKYLPAYASIGSNQFKDVNFIGYRIDWFEDGFTSSGVRLTYTDDNNQEKSLDIPFPGGSWNYGNQKNHKDVCLRIFQFRSIENLDINPFKPDDVAVELPLSIIKQPVYLSIYDDEGNESEKIECKIFENEKSEAQ